MKKFTWNGENHHIIGRYGGHRWHGFWLKVLDVQEAFPLSTDLGQQGFCKQTSLPTRIARVYIKCMV